MNFEAVLFDFDGVIANSKAVHDASWRFAAATVLEIELESLSHYNVSGKSTVEISKIICNFHNLTKKHETFLKEKNRYLESHLHTITFFPGADTLLDLLKTNKIPFGIASNASKFYIKKCLENWNFDVSVVYGYEDYILPKPNPEPYLKLAKALNIDSSLFNDVLIFEDSATGLSAAIDSKMKVAYIKSHCLVPQDIINKTDYSFNAIIDAIHLF